MILAGLLADIEVILPSLTSLFISTGRRASSPLHRGLRLWSPWWRAFSLKDVPMKTTTKSRLFAAAVTLVKQHRRQRRARRPARLWLRPPERRRKVDHIIDLEAGVRYRSHGAERRVAANKEALHSPRYPPPGSYAALVSIRRQICCRVSARPCRSEAGIPRCFR